MQFICSLDGVKVGAQADSYSALQLLGAGSGWLEKLRIELYQPQTKLKLKLRQSLPIASHLPV